MSDLPAFLAHWRYLAIVATVLLGNLGIPIPEEAVFLWSGYLAWSGDLSLPIVILAGVTAAVGGDNIGYRLGRRYGPAILLRRGIAFGATPATMERFVARCGVAAVFFARFVPGLRALAGPLAGVANVPFPRFFAANALGALVFVPMVVTLGYSLGQSAGLRAEGLLAGIQHGRILPSGRCSSPPACCCAGCCIARGGRNTGPENHRAAAGARWAAVDPEADTTYTAGQRCATASAEPWC